MAYTTIDNPSEHFDTLTYSGTGSTQSITGLDFKPDWVWIKKRNAAAYHQLFDSVRGVTKGLFSNTNDDEAVDSGNLQSFISGGFTADGFNGTNASGGTYVAWNWKANGGTTTTNDASSTGVGNTDSVYQANTTAGFSIVTWTGPSGSDARTMAHGLGGTPELIIYKNRDESVAWYVGTSAITFNFNTDYLQLNSDIAKATDAGGTVFVSAPTSTVIGSSSSAATGKENIKYVAYCFRSIQGYSKIGSYTGNGNADGPFVYTGFKPAWLLYRNVSRSENWLIEDIKRNPFNRVAGAKLQANVNDAETSETRWGFDFLSNGFKVRNTEAQNANNGSGETIIYMAFAEHPFVSSEGVPVTAK